MLYGTLITFFSQFKAKAIYHKKNTPFFYEGLKLDPKTYGVSFSPPFA